MHILSVNVGSTSFKYRLYRMDAAETELASGHFEGVARTTGSSRQQAVMRLRDRVIRSAREYLQNNGFILVDSPIISGSAGEGASGLFEIDYFDSKAYLAQTGQLYAEAAAAALELEGPILVLLKDHRGAVGSDDQGPVCQVAGLQFLAGIVFTIHDIILHVL